MPLSSGAGQELTARLRNIIERGFVGVITQGKTIRISCTSCSPSVINNTAVHERGCPNDTRECAGCDTWIPARKRYCKDCQP